jgi:hypothetical protein
LVLVPLLDPFLVPLLGPISREISAVSAEQHLMSSAPDSGSTPAIPAHCALGIGRHRHDAGLDIIAYVEFGEKSSLDSMVGRTTVRTTRERE